ncbi:putative C-S lyase [Ancylomarina euxinus]|uniref:cysteine-S-conjugate beta-lyase n=1 Tax=Ancylomarina euxinus TaxID=2283627 RepID=A0A425Y2H5_9BACT|nr:PatB family C-S lyase [Ancylomarina euxinus]MCZ4694937.1 PatB family C-S lyase [Ancylomarina euxinus]MUP14803.1 putative C-S lyase [Ancylomarina euxinus]RRG22147.1 putative C-S lyase [Ancylomarina euxinus]
MQYDFDKIIDRKNTNSVKHDALQTFFGTVNILPLWVADMDFESPDFIRDALKDRLNHPVYAYTFFSDSFYSSLIKWMKDKHDHRIEASWLKVTPGVLTGISMAIMALTNPGDKIIIQPPVYHPFFHLVKSNDRVLVQNELTFENGCYKMDFEHLEKCIDKDTKMIIISNPHNPVGRVWTKEELKKLVAICAKNKILIIADEIHSDIVFEPNQYTPIASISSYAHNNSLTFVAPSKTFNIAGLSTSVAIIPNRKLRKQFIALASRLHLDSGNVFGTVAFEAAYTHGKEWLNQLITYLKGNVELVKSYFAEHLPTIKVVEPEGTYLLWLDFSALNLEDECLHQILIDEAEVAMNKGISFGLNGHNFMRLNIGSPQAVILEGLERMVSALKRYERV